MVIENVDAVVAMDADEVGKPMMTTIKAAKFQQEVV
jgi:hypothetical protein